MCPNVRVVWRACAHVSRLPASVVEPLGRGACDAARLRVVTFHPSLHVLPSCLCQLRDFICHCGALFLPVMWQKKKEHRRPKNVSNDSSARLDFLASLRKWAPPSTTSRTPACHDGCAFLQGGRLGPSGSYPGSFAAAAGTRAPTQVLYAPRRRAPSVQKTCHFFVKIFSLFLSALFEWMLTILLLCWALRRHRWKRCRACNDEMTNPDRPCAPSCGSVNPMPSPLNDPCVQFESTFFVA